jgi:hypothetical protein
MSGKKKSESETNLTLSDIAYIKSTIESFILPKGTLLYRTQPEKYGCNVKSSYDEDTGKSGIYFANSIHIPLGMVLEYNKPLNLCVYQTTKDLKIYIGKYSFRSLEPDLFFKNLQKWKTGRNHSGVPQEKKYWNHYDKEAFPIHDMFSGENENIWRKINIGEIFITDEDDIKFIKLDGLITVEEANLILQKELDQIKNVQVAGKNSNKPKRGLSAFMFYIRERHKPIKDAEPNISFGEIGKKIGLEWGSLTYGEKARFQKLAVADKARYEKEMENYTPSPGRVTKKRRKKKDPNAPKRSKSAFMLFAIERRPQLVEENPEWSFTDYGIKMGEEWRGMADLNKAKYENASKEDKIRYDKEMVSYVRT